MNKNRNALSLGPFEIGKIRNERIVLTNFVPWFEEIMATSLDINANYFVSIGWYSEFPETGFYYKSLKEVINSYPNIRFTILLNCPTSYHCFREKLPEIPCAYVSELLPFFIRHNYGEIFKPLPGPRHVKYSAVLAARRFPYKNRDLASGVENIALITQGGAEIDPDVHFPSYLNTKFLTHSEINVIFNHSACGLMLSFVEGAGRTTIEYLLSGLPIISFQSKGGRHVFLDEENSIVLQRLPGRRDAMKQSVNQAVKSVTQGMLFNRTRIRTRALRRLSWFYDRLALAIANSMGINASELASEIAMSILSTCPSIIQVLRLDPLPPVERTIGEPVFISSGSSET